MEIEKLIVSVINEMTYYLLKNGAYMIYNEIITLENNFHVMIEANMGVSQDMLSELRKLSKIKDYPELKYYSSLATNIGNLQDIYAIAPLIKKFEISVDEKGITIEIYVER